MEKNTEHYEREKNAKSNKQKSNKEKKNYIRKVAKEIMSLNLGLELSSLPSHR